MTDLFAEKSEKNVGAAHQNRPMADILRPDALDDVVGQDHLLGVEGSLRRMVEAGALSSLILWGPPGCGKTTIARILAQHSDLHFEQISAIFSGVADLRKVFESAKIRKTNGQGTLLFVDEIHRFNKSQQDAFLPVMEDGTITLIGATTENPSFELNAAVLSRAQVFVLKRIDEDGLEILLIRGEERQERKLPMDAQARDLLKTMADGDGRYILSMVEQIFAQMNDDTVLDSEALLNMMQRRAPLYDKGNDAHFNLISAFHKSLRGSDVDGALYWMARMLQAGENPDYILRRMTCVASEDVSMADPQALPLVIAAWQAYERLGQPEGELAMAQACVYLATAPKSNASYMALKAAKRAAKETGSLMPPKHAMNAPTKLMKAEGYNLGYQYDHDTPEGFSGQNYFPDDLPRRKFYEPVERGFERDIKKRLDYWARLRQA
ncbi:MAG: AAA family ATPase [Alphaproteobacteria bacterium]|nr:MAG: AAA family ATPase [Alphaproteobacteria bacterium]